MCGARWPSCKAPWGYVVLFIRWFELWWCRRVEDSGDGDGRSGHSFPSTTGRMTVPTRTCEK